MRRMHTDQEITKLVEENPSVKTALALATETAKTYKTAELVLDSGDFDAVFDAKTTPYETSDPEEPAVINALLGADIIIVFSDGASGTTKENPHFFRKMRYSETEETAYFECLEMDNNKLYHYEMSVSSVDEGGAIGIYPFKTFEPLLSDIVDADGHKRFQEWDITTPTIEGVTFTYAKASLSGTHLMLVIAGTIANGTTIANSQQFGSITLPSWIHDKIVALWSTNVNSILVTLYANDYTSQSGNFLLAKGQDNLTVVKWTALTLTAERNFRIQYDLLID